MRDRARPARRDPALVLCERCLNLRILDRVSRKAGPRHLQGVATGVVFDDDPANEQLIELSFSESDGATTVLFVNTGITTDARRDSQDRGWNGCLDQLERALAG